MKIGHKIIRLKTCSSTNDLAIEMALKGDPEGTVVVSETQTRGRGRKQRVWFSPRGKGLYMSVILRPPKSNISLLSLAAGMAVSDATRDTAGIRVLLKWPNDLVWQKWKLGGILCESSFLGNHLNYVILGIGLNISQRKEDFPGELLSSSISIEAITNKEIDRKILLEKVLEALNYWYSLFLNKHDGEIEVLFRKYSVVPIGKEIVIETDMGNISGVYNGIDTHGGLILNIGGKDSSFYDARIKIIKGLTEG